MIWSLAGLAAIALALLPVGLFQQELLNFNGLPQLWRFVRASIQPDLSLEMLQLTSKATLTTLAYAICGTFLSLILGIIAGVLSSEVWWQGIGKTKGTRHKAKSRTPNPEPRTPNPFSSPHPHFPHPPSLPLFTLFRAILSFPRAIHELIWGLFFVNLWGLDPLTAILAIAIPFGAITAKVFSDILDETPRQPLQILLNSGVPPLSALFYSLLPQAFLNLLSYAFYRFECSIRSAAVLGIIGAGGLGYQIMLSLQSLRYEQLWTFFYALFLLNGLVDFTSAWLRRQLGCASRLDLNLKRKAESGTQKGWGGREMGRWGGWGGGERRGWAEFNPRTPHPTPHTPNPQSSPPIFHLKSLCLVLGVLCLVLFSFWYINPNFSKLWAARTRQLFAEIVQSAWPPDWSIAAQLVPLSIETVAMSVLAIALAGIGGMLLAFLAAHNFSLPGGLLNPGWRQSRSLLPQIDLFLSRAVLLMGRSIPAPIWALVALFVLFPGILPGAIALGLHNLGILGRLKAEAIENLDQRPLEALKAQGAPATSVFLYGVLPVSLPRFLAYDLYRWEVCMRETVIVGLVGAGGLGRLLTEQLSSFDYRGIVMTLGAFLALTVLVDWLSGLVRRSLR
jgi:phosphonate transport system permease protein